MTILRSLILVMACMFISAPLMAQDKAANNDDFESRLLLARQIQELRPVRTQVEQAIAAYLQRIPEIQRDSYKRAIDSVISYKALEKISVDAYAETFTKDELAAMLDYYKKPESASAAAKIGQYTGRVMPEITRMLDRAMMRVRTGG